MVQRPNDYLLKLTNREFFSYLGENTMAMDQRELGARVNELINELTRFQRDLAGSAVVEPTPDTSMTLAQWQEYSARAQDEAAAKETPKVSTVTKGAASMEEASGGRLANTGEKK